MSRAIGKTPSTTAVTEIPVEGTTYTEPTTNGQRSLVSSSANDAAAGTGARTVRIMYFSLNTDGSVSGPFTETVTLNGTSAVATVATNICYIERMDVMSAGSGGAPAGTISLNTAPDGSGSTICSIAAGDESTFFAHHYVASNKQCHVLDVLALGGVATASLFEVKTKPLPSGIEQPFINALAATNAATTQFPIADRDRVVVPGPARVRLYVAPASTTAQVNQGSFGFRDEQL